MQPQKKTSVVIHPVNPYQSGNLHNEILELFSQVHPLKPTSLSKEEFVKDFKECANKALKNRGINTLVSNEYVEDVINEIKYLKEKGIYDFFDPQKSQNTGKFLRKLAIKFKGSRSSGSSRGGIWTISSGK